MDSPGVHGTPTPGSLGLPAYDYVALNAAPTVDTWTFFAGGASGTLVATVVITYTDATKATIQSVAKS